MKKSVSILTSLIILLTPLSGYCEEILPAEDPSQDEITEPVFRETSIYGSVPITSMCNDACGIRIEWKNTDADGYLIYRLNDDGTWDEINAYSGPNSRSYTDNSSPEGSVSSYKVLSFVNTTVDYEEEGDNEFPELTGNDASSSYMYLAPPKGLKLTRDGNTMTVNWTGSEGAAGYVVEYCKNSMFKGAKAKRTSDTSVMINKLNAEKKYYVRVKAVTDSYESYWSHSKNIKGTKKASVSYLKNNGKRVDVRKTSKQKLYGYDTIQGSTSDGTYSYTILLNKSNNRCRIIKMRAGTSKLVKVSGVLNLGHGNDMAYDPDNRRLVVAHGSQTKRTVTIVDPKTLKRVKKVRITIPDEINGVSLKKLQKKPYFGGISYIPLTGEYALKATYLNMIIYLDQGFEPVRVIKMSTTPKNLNQNTHITEDYIYRITSPSPQKAGNIIYAYDRMGIYLGCIKIPVLGELEGIYFVGNKLYASVYRSRYITVTKKTVKYVTKIKKVKGKKKKVRKKKIITRKYKKFYRDSYVIRIRDY